jgi:hypothetical protein
MTMVILENGGIFAAAFSVVVAETLCDFIFWGALSLQQDPPVQQRMDLYLNTNIGVASALTNGFSMRCVFERCKGITQRIYKRW